MKEIFIIRHAKSSWDHIGLTDKERPLNKRGERDAPLMAQYLSDKGLKPQVLITSPAVRASATADRFKKVLGSEVRIEIESDLYHGYKSDFLHAIHNLDEQWTSVALFGHNPTITELANLCSSMYIDNVPTCGVLQIQQQIPDWKSFNFEMANLVEYFFPKLVL